MDTTLFNGTDWLNKVPAITFAFWVIKIMSTTVGETGADFLAVNAGWGQAVTAWLWLGSWWPPSSLSYGRGATPRGSIG